MTLFDSESQYRERATIWRVFSLLPLYANLAGGRVMRWFAINIPMDLGTGGEFTSDIDVLACLDPYPASGGQIFRAWEVKVSLLCKDGTARSLKTGKLPRTITQLRAYRNFGAPAVSLLDVYICEAGFLRQNAFPPPSLHDSIQAKVVNLHQHRFGYQILPFEHGKDGDDDVGLFLMQTGPSMLQTMVDLLPPLNSRPSGPFRQLAARIDDFFGNTGGQAMKQVTFCRECRRLQRVKMKVEYECPDCGADLVAQS